MFLCFINIQFKDANKQKLTEARRTNVVIYMCTKFAVCFVYVDTINSVCSWQILYGNPRTVVHEWECCDNQNYLIAVTHCPASVAQVDARPT